MVSHTTTLERGIIVPTKPGNHTVAMVAKLPKCQLCPGDRDAEYDAKTIVGPWANMCAECFETYGIGLGLGRGQKLVVA
jgi:hypothetical protein